MTSTGISSTEAISIDMTALRNWHYHSSMDAARTPAMRKWHRRQAEIIGRKIPKVGNGALNPMKTALIEFLSDRYRRLTLSRCHTLLSESETIQEAALGFEWRQFCEAKRKTLEHLAHHEPSNSQSTSSGCDSEGKAVGGSPSHAAESKSESSPAKACSDALPLEPRCSHSEDSPSGDI